MGIYLKIDYTLNHYSWYNIVPRGTLLIKQCYRYFTLLSAGYVLYCVARKQLLIINKDIFGIYKAQFLDRVHCIKC